MEETSDGIAKWLLFSQAIISTCNYVSQSVENNFLVIFPCQVEQTADSVSSSGVHVSKGSQSATFVRSKRHSDASRGTVH